MKKETLDQDQQDQAVQHDEGLQEPVANGDHAHGCVLHASLTGQAAPTLRGTCRCLQWVWQSRRTCVGPGCFRDVGDQAQGGAGRGGSCARPSYSTLAACRAGEPGDAEALTAAAAALRPCSAAPMHSRCCDHRICWWAG